MILDDLGRRICILGPSNSGKSTLATAIGRARNLPVIYLDQLHHSPGTDWQPRPVDEFVTLHDEAILGMEWVIEGNYSRCLPQRLERATGVILLDASTTTSLFRFFRRSWFERDRIGSLEGARDRVDWTMIRHICVTARANRRRYKAMYDRLALPKIRLEATREATPFYETESLVASVSRRGAASILRR